MLIVAALLTVAVGLMHSVVGGRRLIEPIAAMDGLPVILGSVERTKLTLRVGWHALSLTWWGMAVALVLMQAVPETKSALFLWMTAGVFGLCGISALLSVSRAMALLKAMSAAASRRVARRILKRFPIDAS